MAEEPVIHEDGDAPLLIDDGEGNLVPAIADDPCDCCESCITLIDFSVSSTECEEACFTPSVGLEDFCDCTPTYEWDFGDGETSTLESPCHSYTEDCESNYDVTLTVTCNGETQSVTKTITPSDYGCCCPDGCVIGTPCSRACGAGYISFHNAPSNMIFTLSGLLNDGCINCTDANASYSLLFPSDACPFSSTSEPQGSIACSTYPTNSPLYSVYSITCVQSLTLTTDGSHCTITYTATVIFYYYVGGSAESTGTWSATITGEYSVDTTGYTSASPLYINLNTLFTSFFTYTQSVNPAASPKCDYSGINLNVGPSY